MTAAVDFLIEALLKGCAISIALLEASRLEVLQGKYPQVQPDVLKAIAFADPSSLKVEGPAGELKKAGGYTDWMIRQYLARKTEWTKRHHGHFGSTEADQFFNGQFLDEDLPKTAADLQVYHRQKGKLPAELRDINKLTFTTLWDAAESLRDKAPEAEGGKADKIFQDSDWVVIIPRDKEAAAKYGAGTRWCTAAREDNYFEQYSAEGPLFIVIKRQGDEKWQLHFESEQYMDSSDDPVDLREFARSLPLKVRQAIVDNARSNRALGLMPEEIIRQIKSGHYAQPDLDLIDLMHWFTNDRVTGDEFNSVIQKSDAWVKTGERTHKPLVPGTIYVKDGLIYAGVDSYEPFESMFDSQSKWVSKTLAGDGDYDYAGYTPDAHELDDFMSHKLTQYASKIAAMGDQPHGEEDDLDAWMKDDEIVDALQDAYREMDGRAYESSAIDGIVSAVADALGTGDFTYSSPSKTGFAIAIAGRGRLPDYITRREGDSDSYPVNRMRSSHVIELFIDMWYSYTGDRIHADPNDNHSVDRGEFSTRATELLKDIEEMRTPAPEEVAPSEPESALPDPTNP